MTQTARIVAALEAAHPDEQTKIQSPGCCDWIFRSTLALTYDPFIHNDWPEGAEVPALPENLAKLDDWLAQGNWITFSSDVRDASGYEYLRNRWGDTQGWPLFARVIRKRFENVTYDTVNSVWQTLPKFVAAPIGVGALTFPRVVVPHVGQRAILVVRVAAFGIRVDLFDPTGKHINAQNDELVSELASKFALPNGEGHVWNAVFDGFVQSRKGGVFAAFDMAYSLDDFRAQRTNSTFYERRLINLQYVRANLACPHGRCPFEVALVRRVERAAELESLVANGLLADSQTGSAFGIDPNSAYPYSEDYSYQHLYLNGKPVQ